MGRYRLLTNQAQPKWMRPNRRPQAQQHRVVLQQAVARRVWVALAGQVVQR
jgi:hypothetical protein